MVVGGAGGRGSTITLSAQLPRLLQAVWPGQAEGEVARGPGAVLLLPVQVRQVEQGGRVPGVQAAQHIIE